jgi:hypothetical protein
MEYSTTPLTRGFMTAALDSLHTKPDTWAEPAGIQHLPAFVVRSHVGIGSVEPSPNTDIFPSWYKPKTGNTAASTIDKVSNKIATGCTPALAKQTLGGTAAPNSFSVDVFYPPGSNPSAASNASGNDDIHNCSDAKPTVTLTVSGPDASGNYTLTAFAQAGTHPLSDGQYPQFPGTVNFMVNGQQVGSQPVSGDSQTVSINYHPASSGEATVTAQVIDSVLYDATSEAQTINFSLGPAGPTNVTATNHSGKTTISWEGGTGPFTVTDSPAGNTGCTSSGCKVDTVKAPPGSTVTVTDSTGKSQTATVGGP